MKKLSEYFRLTKVKLVVFLGIFALAMTTLSSPWCTGGKCNIELHQKVFHYASQVFLPGLTNLFKENAFFIGQTTYGPWDAIPQLIFHVGVDLVYLYIFVCIVLRFVGWLRAK